MLVFNPPYVPTEDEEMTGAQAGRAIEGSWAGGQQGMLVTAKVLQGLDVGLFLPFNFARFYDTQYAQDILSENGLFYLVAVKDNDVPSIRKRMEEDYSFESEVRLPSPHD